MERVLKNMGIWLMQLIVATLLMTAGSQSVKARTSSTTTTPVQPTAIFTPTGLEVTVGQLNFTRPTLSVTDPNTKKPIRGKFIERWHIKDKDGNIVTKSEEVDNRVMYTDPTTGTTVSLLYGLDAIGDKAGTFTVVDELQPLSRYKDQYTEVVAQYTVTVKSPTVTAEYYNGSTLLNGTTPNALQLYTCTIKNKWGGYTSGATTVPVPSAKLYYKLDNATYDVTSDFTFAYKVTDGFSISNNTIKASLKDAGQGTLTITATPKDAAKAKYGSTDIVTNIPIKVYTHTGKIKTYIYFAKHEEDTYKFHKNSIDGRNDLIYSPDVIVKDEFGNDITNLVTNTWNIKWPNEAQNVFQKFSKDPHDSKNEISASYGSLTSTNTISLTIQTQTGSSKNIYGKIIFGRPDDYLVTVKDVSLSNTNIYEKPVADPKISETVEGQFYNANGNAPYSKENTYTVGSNQMILRVHKRVPAIKLTPDPSTVQLAANYTMNSFNRFNIGGIIRDPYDATDPVDSASNFHYRFFLPDNMKYGSDAANKEPNNVTLEVTTNAPQTDCYEWVPVYHNGVLEKNEDGSQKMELMHGTYYESWKGYNNDDFKMLFHLPSGVEFAENVPIIYSIVPWNPTLMDIGISGYYSFKVTKKDPTHFVIDPKSQVTGTGGTVPCPSITVQDQFGEDITSYFTVSKKKAKDSEAYTLNPDGSVTSTTAGSYDVTVSGTLTDTESAASNGRFFDNPADDSYTAVFKQTSSGSVGAYEIIYDEKEFSTDAKTKATSKMGKLHFINDGEFFPGTISYGEVPGINITFGNADDNAGNNANPWTINTSTEKSDIDNANDGTADNVSKEYIEGDAVTFDGNTGLPNAGCYLKIEAVTNGWLTIDVKFLGHKDKGDNLTEPEQFILRDGTTLETQVHSETTDIIKEYTFPKPLLAGHTYYLYTNDGNMKLHGINYAPGFIDPVTDARPWTTPGAVDLDSVRVSSTFMNGYTGTLPTLAMHRQNEHVSWYVLDVPSGSSSTSVDDIKEQTNNDAKHVYVGQNDGRIYAEALTTEAPLTDNSRKNTDAYGRVRVFAKVLGKKLSNGSQVKKLPGYYLFVGDMPTYIVQEGESHSQDDRVSTTNIPTRIWMTFGGWHWSQAKEYPYYKNNIKKDANWLEDGWKTSKMDSVGRNNQTIDGFTFVTFGEQNPTDEFVRSWDKGEHNTFSLPVRGTYLKFEPEESGQLFVYLVQNGMTDNTKGDDAAKLKKNGPWLRRRAVYIVDETGHPVAIDDLSGWQAAGDWNQYINPGTTNADRFPGYHNWHLNYYCDGVTRCAWKYDGTNELAISTADPASATAKKDEKKYSWFNAYDHDHDGKLTDKESKAMTDDADKIKTWWTTENYLYPTTTVNGKNLGFTYSHAKLDGPLEVLQLSDTSYVLPTKGYVRYTFHVQAGKVYYVFATGSKLGFCGFGFLPAGYRSNPATWINAGQPNEYGEFDESVYDKLPKPSNDIYTAGGTGQNRLMGGTVTLDVKKKANEDGSYGTFKKGGFVLRGETTATSDNTTSDNTTAKRDFVNVTLQRSFRNQRWAGLCLPFTVSETQMKRIFGDDMQLITVDSVMASKDHERTLHFTQHVNQLCEAGRPYFVYPNVSGIDAGQPIGTSVTFNGVTFEGVDAATVVMTNDSVVAHNAKAENANNKINIFTYKVTGIYDKSIIPWMSYYMRNTENETTNKLYRIVPAGSTTSKGTYLPGCNVYLFPYSADPEGKELVVTDDGTVNPAKLASFWITGAEVSGGSTTGIDELVNELNEQSTAFHRGVYDLQGHCVSSDNSLKGLRPGIYLMGGKKYVVK